MEKERVFEMVSGPAVKVTHRKSAVFLELAEEAEGYAFHVEMDEETFRALHAYLEACAAEAWKEVTVKEADSHGNDYYEYYSRELDNNGYLDITRLGFRLERPALESLELYKFNKAKMGTFLYDLREAVQQLDEEKGNA